MPRTMGGAALSRLWDTNPKIAFVLHLLVCIALGLVFVVFLFGGYNWVTVLLVGVLFGVDVAALVLATIDAAQRGWTRS